MPHKNEIQPTPDNQPETNTQPLNEQTNNPLHGVKLADILEYLVEEIHNDARVDRGNAWAGSYVGRKPFTRSGRDWLRRQATIFYKAR